MLMEDDQVALAKTLGQTFFQRVRERQADRLNDWINQALESKISILKSFARGLQQDYAAVHAALHLEWSSGQIEGQVNRLKLIKREMYGRAKFDLLRKRVLGPAPYA
jgi:transposase